MNLFKWRSGSGNNTTQSNGTQASKPSYIPLMRGIASLVDDGPPRLDGSDKFFGMENVVNGEKFGNTCYCNSILQCLYFSKPFRECVLNYPHRSMLSSNDISAVSSTFLPPYATNGNGSAMGLLGPGKSGLTRINTEPAVIGTGSNSASPNSTVRSAKSPLSPATPKDDSKRKSIPMIAAVQLAPPPKVEDPNSPEAKKKAALVTGPLLKVDAGNSANYGMHETLFSALKDIFETIISHTSRTGVISPQKFVEVLKRENEMFRSSVHQDAHEFLNYVLNQIIENVEQYQKRLLSAARANGTALQSAQLLTVKPPGKSNSVTESSAASTASGATTSATVMSNLSAGWIHDLFEGLLTSETKCLTCETVSRRDEVFLDLSIDLDKHTSVTSCLNNFSASEMLCERNKFHCDGCGGLQEAEKRMKIKRLPRILALHLKRFKYSEEIGRHQKLFHRVVYPYYLRLFNTTDDAEDPDRLYELYAVVVHIGGGPYHGHYVTIVKTEDKGWLLFDDELVEPVDKSYVRNFFGDEKKLACAYVLFYQETTFEKMEKEMNEDLHGKPHATAPVPVDEISTINSAVLKEKPLNGDITHLQVIEVDDVVEEKQPLTHSLTTPLPLGHVPPEPGRTPAEIAAEHLVPPKSKKEQERLRKEEKAAEKAAAKAAKLATNEDVMGGEVSREGKEKEKTFGRFRTSSKSLARGHSWFGGSGMNGKDRREMERKSYENGTLHGTWEENQHYGDATVVTNGNGTAIEGKNHEETPIDPLEVPKEDVKDEQHHHPSLPPPPPPPPPQVASTHPVPTLPPLPGKPLKEKKKGLWSGLKRKTSIMMNDV